MKIRITDDGNKSDIDEIHEMLKEYNLINREVSKNVPIGIFYEDENNKKLAGLTGETFGNWLCIQYLFVAEQLRKNALCEWELQGQRLLPCMRMRGRR